MAWFNLHTPHFIREHHPGSPRNSITFNRKNQNHTLLRLLPSVLRMVFGSPELFGPCQGNSGLVT